MIGTLTGMVMRAAGLTAVYLLVLTSLAPGDILVGGLLALGLVAALRSRRPTGSRTSAWRWIGAVVVGIASTAAEVAIGTWRTVRFCFGAAAHPGLIEIPRDGRSARSVALWGVVTGEAPDEYPVDVDEERDVLIVHILDASDPGAVRARHRRAYDTWQRHVVR